MDAQSTREFLDFVSARSPALLRTAYALTGDQHAAQDLLQSALARTAVRWRRIEEAPEAYVRRAMVNEQVSWWRRRRVLRIDPSAFLPERPSGDPSHDVDLRLSLRAALLRLAPRQRAVLVLRYLEDLSVEDTAAVLGCKPSTVGSQTTRALARLRALAPELARTDLPEEARS